MYVKYLIQICHDPQWISKCSYLVYNNANVMPVFINCKIYGVCDMYSDFVGYIHLCIKFIQIIQKKEWVGVKMIIKGSIRSAVLWQKWVNYSKIYLYIHIKHTLFKKKISRICFLCNWYETEYSTFYPAILKLIYF